MKDPVAGTRRLEGKFLSLGLELKSVQVLINTETVHGNRQAYLGHLVDIAFSLE